jgi:ribosomal protein S18 acetylase RimI-like enzyme
VNSSTQAPGKVFDSGKIVRRASVADVESVLDLAKEISTVAQWSYSDYETYCATGKLADTRAKALFVCCALSPRNTISACGEVLGFAAFSAIPHVGNGECELENMGVAEPWRRQGIAMRLLAAGLLWCRAWCPADHQGAPPSSGLSLEVRAANRSAIAFYEGTGFKAIGRRPAYYTQPDEDAVLMWKSLDAAL